MPDATAPATSARRHPETVEVTVLPGKEAVVHRVKYKGGDKGHVLTVHKKTAEQLIKDGVAKAGA